MSNPMASRAQYSFRQYEGAVDASQGYSRRGKYLAWVAVTIFVLSNILNFLDRQLLAALAPSIKTAAAVAAYGITTIGLATPVLETWLSLGRHILPRLQKLRSVTVSAIDSIHLAF